MEEPGISRISGDLEAGAGEGEGGVQTEMQQKSSHNGGDCCQFLSPCEVQLRTEE